MYPSSPAVLEINGMTITSNVQHQLIKAHSEPKYIHYLQQKKQVEKQNSEFNSTEMSEPGHKENRQRSHTCKDL